ncbi:restriction endonuclease subunit S [Clostridium thailandense]|uniref:restriction endonuclease subunit S n=1 Tax=Clostridium thailandense TaxID=2794346 RepID=UPI003989BE31
MNREIAERINIIKRGKVPKEYKKSQVGLIPMEWKEIKLAKINNISTGLTPLRSKNQYFNGNIYWVKTTDLNNSYIYDTEEKVTNIALIETSLKYVEKNSILIAMYGGFNQIGRTGLMKVRGTTNQAISSFYIDEKEFNSEFILHWLNFNRGYWKRLASSSRKDPNITKKDVEDFLIVKLPYLEQKKIANIISNWDKAIEVKKKLVQEKQKQKKGLIQRLLTGKVRLKGFSEEWKEVKLSKIFDRVTRKNSVGNSNVLTISAQQGLINQKNFFNKLVASNMLDNYYLLNKGEFAYNKSYSNGYPMGAIKRLNNYESGVVTTLYICFKLKDKFEKSSDFFEQYFESGLMNKGLTQIAYEGGRAHGLLNVSPNDFFNLKVSIPSIEEQVEIANILKTCDNEIILLQKEIEALKQQKKGLMQLLLTGIVRVKCD